MGHDKEIEYAYPHLDHADYIDHEGRATQYIAVKHGNGMTLRDWFAGQALASIFAATSHPDDRTAMQCYAMADAMLKARKQQCTSTSAN